jgi:hypothetical protein
MTVNSLELRRAIRAKFAWPGGYELVFITSDGECLCADCARKEYRNIAYANRHGLRDGWRIDGIDNGSSTDSTCPCAHCGRELSAYYEAEQAAE